MSTMLEIENARTAPAFEPDQDPVYVFYLQRLGGFAQPPARYERMFSGWFFVEDATGQCWWLHDDSGRKLLSARHWGKPEPQHTPNMSVCPVCGDDKRCPNEVFNQEGETNGDQIGS